jgi:hypothetical protein
LQNTHVGYSAEVDQLLCRPAEQGIETYASQVKNTDRENRARIARKRDAVFLTREFRDLGGEDQVLRALRLLVRRR